MTPAAEPQEDGASRDVPPADASQPAAATFPVMDRTSPAPPGAAVRAESALIRLDGVFARLDGWLNRWVPAELNPLAQAGAAANLALVVAVASGVLMLLWYSPSLQFAYPSLTAIAGRTLGGMVRGVHRYSSDLVMLLVLVHAGRVFLARKFGGARWLPWVSGVGMLALVWLIGWTGYWLVWDQPAQQVAVTSMRLLDGLPIFGEPLGRLYVADRTVPSLLFFVVFFTHMLLPLAIAVGLAVHLARVSRARLLPRRGLAWSLVAGLVLAAVLVPAPLDAPARMAEKAPTLIADAWYLSPLALALRLQHAGLWIALLGGTTIAALVPWLLGRRRASENYQAVVNPSRCHACTQCAQDCPFDAITMVPRTDGKRFPSQAWVDSSRCIGCGVCAGSCDSEGIGLSWFDTRIEEARLEREIAVAVGDTSRPRWVALVCAEIDGGFDRVARASWAERLPGYQIHFVPTSSWVRPKFVERVLAGGASGVLVVRDARAEAWSRDGRAWVLDRLAGVRTPIFRPERAASESWRVVDFDASRPAAVTAAAAEFRAGQPGWPERPVRAWPKAFAAAALVAALTAAGVAPSRVRVSNPATPEPELVLSFKTLGERMAPAPLDPAVEATKPVYMRGRTTEKPHRADVVVRLTIDGVTHERRFGAKGISRDGPAIGEWRVPLTPGPHAVGIELLHASPELPHQWAGEINAQPRHLSVITCEPAAGFRVE